MIQFFQRYIGSLDRHTTLRYKHKTVLSEPALPYAFDRLQTEASALISATGLVPSELIRLAEPKRKFHADVALCTFAAAKATHREPKELALRLAAMISLPSDSLIERVEAVGAYLHFYRHQTRFAVAVLSDVFERENSYGHSYSVGQGKNAAVEFPAENLARRPGTNTLRYAAMGQSLSLILTALGYNVGTSIAYEETSSIIGQMLAALDWAKQEPWHELNPARALEDIYGRFLDPSHWNSPEEPVEVAVAWRTKWENGDTRARETWQHIVAMHRWEFESLFNRLSVLFEHTLEESLLQSVADEVVAEALQKGVAHAEEGKAVAVHFGKGGKALPSCLLRKTDGRSLYLTRVLARMIWRCRNEPFDCGIYVIPAEQKLLFEQAFEIMRRLGQAHIVEKCRAIPVEPFYEGCFGRGEYGLASESISLQRRTSPGVVMDAAVTAAKPFTHRWITNDFESMGIGEVKFASLSTGPEHPVRTILLNNSWWGRGTFQLYIHRAHAFCRYVVDDKRLARDPEYGAELSAPQEQALLKHLARMPLVVRAAGEKYRPAIIARWTYDLARLFGHFYADFVRPDAEFKKIILTPQKEVRTRARLQLAAAVAQGLRNGLALLGITVSRYM